MELSQVLEKLVNFGMDAGKSILAAALIYIIGRIIIRYINKLVAKIMKKRHMEISFRRDRKTGC